MGFTPCKAERPLQGMEPQEKEAWSIYIGKLFRKKLQLTVNISLLILDLKLFRL